MPCNGVHHGPICDSVHKRHAQRSNSLTTPCSNAELSCAAARHPLQVTWWRHRLTD